MAIQYAMDRAILKKWQHVIIESGCQPIIKFLNRDILFQPPIPIKKILSHIKEEVAGVDTMEFVYVPKGVYFFHSKRC